MSLLIDEFLPVYDAVERHQIAIRAPTESVYRAVRALDLSASPIIRWLMMLRGLPSLLRAANPRAEHPPLNFEGFLSSGFVLLGERTGHELVLGLIGRFWTPAGDIQRVDVRGFRAFEQPGYAKAVWSFEVARLACGMTGLATETRIHCLDNGSRRRFRPYWLCVSPFSGLIRKEMLRGIKRKVELSRSS